MSTQFYAKSLTLLLLCISISGFGQKSDSLLFGKLQTNLKGYELTDMFGTSDAYFYSLRQNRRKKYAYVLQKVSTDSLNVLESKTFNFPPIQGEEPNFESVFSIGDKNYLIASTRNSDNDTVNVLAFEIVDPLDLKPVPKLLARGVGRTLSAKRGFRVFKDPVNKVFTLIVPSEQNANKNEKFELRLFDQNMDLLKFKMLEVPYPSGVTSYEDALVDSLGSIYVLTSISNPTLTSVNEDRNIGKDFSLFKYSWATETLTEKSLSLGVKWLYDVKLINNSSQNIQIVGYYSNMVDLIMAGTFSLDLNPENGAIIHQGLSQFDRDFRVRFRPSGSNITETQLGKFKLNNVFALPGDNTMLLSEKNYTETTTVLNPGTGTYAIITIYNYDEVLISVMDASSKIEYNLHIPKYQSSTTAADEYTSYLSFRGSEKTYVIYNDDRRNESLSLSAEKGYRQLTTGGSSAAMLVTIDSTGKMVKAPLFTPSDFHEVFNPNLHYQTSHAIILTAMTGYEIRYIKLKLD